MTNASTKLKIRLYFVLMYLAAGMLFTWGMYGLSVHKCDELPGAVSSVREEKHNANENAMASVVMPISLDWLSDITHYQLLLCTSILAFVMVYGSTPVFKSIFSDGFASRLAGGKETDHLQHSRNIPFVKTQNGRVSSHQESSVAKVLRAMLDNNFDVQIDTGDSLSELLTSMQQKFRSIAEKESLTETVHSNVNEIERLLKDESDQLKLNDALIRQISKSVNAGVGVLYKWNDSPDDQHFFEVASYGFYDNRHTKKRVSKGEGQLGEMSIHKRPVLLTSLPKGYLVIQSGLGSSTATDVGIFPLLFKGELYGAIEIALFHPLTSAQVTWLERASESIGAHFFNYKVNSDTKAKLEMLTKKQAEELVEIHKLQETTLRKLESKLIEVEDEKIKSAQILEGCVDGVITFNESGSIQFCNKAAEELLGCSRDNIHHKKIQELLPVVIREDFGVCKPFYVISPGEKEITVRTEATLETFGGGTVDTLLTCTKVEHKGGILFTFFIQKISVDLF
jgi:PAS domain S-box-containing protein